MSSTVNSAIRRRAASMKQQKTSVSLDRQSTFKKALTMNKRTSQLEKSDSVNVFSIFGDKRRFKHDDSDAALDLLDQKIAKIRSDLLSMQAEDQTFGQRVANVTSAVDAVVAESRSCSSSLDSIDEQKEDCCEQVKTELKGSVSSLPDHSKRDSGFVYDPKFEMCDPQRYCMPNNFVSLSSVKKARSTTAVDFIKNNLHEDDRSERLKATSIDRLSCYSDSALLAIPNFRYH